MHPFLLDELAAARVEELRREAARGRVALPLLRPSPVARAARRSLHSVRVPARRGRPATGHGRRAAGPRRPERGVRRPADFQAREPGPTTYLDGVRAAAPIGVAALAFGVSFGVLARAADMGRVAPVVMSVTTFAGSAQFAVASILGAGGGLVTAIVAAVLLNLRYGPIGLSAATTFEGPVVAAGADRPADRGRVLGHRPARRRPPGPAPAGRGRPAPARLLDHRHGHRRPSPATWSPTPSRSASTPPSRPCSWPCSGPRSATARASWPPSAAPPSPWP